MERGKSEEWQQVQRRKQYGREFDINGKAVTSTSKTFLQIGLKQRCGRLLGDTGPFLRIPDVLSFEKRLNGIYIGAQKIDVNVAKFDRKELAIRNNSQGRQNGPGSSQKSHLRGNKSFANAVKGINHPVEDARNMENSKAGEGTRKTADEESCKKTINLLSSAEVKEYMQNTLLVGEVENFQALMNVKAFQEVEGCQSINMRYLGGLKMLIEFANVNVKDNFLRNGAEIWQPWFKSLKQWRVEDNHNERVASIIIQGVPQQAWCEEAFSIIASDWGTVLSLKNVLLTPLIWLSVGLEF
ncbi:unnamed protein product [Lactuca virosa]|uniref:DUF4283 domain-containing protein n=1 Tax=Lactuca virosa TaxID=75947 RepID=A0AAU9MJR1_9ASTR|nr:unnamed protein product [Lactuca virosa]